MSSLGIDTTSAGAQPEQGKLAHLRYHLLCCMAYTLACLAWNDWAGQDLNFDQLHYHAYVALAWWQGRIPEELFAASVQSYLNPLPHLPFFAALSTGWSSLAIASLMAVLHSINLWILHAISAMLMPPINRLNRLLVFVGVILGGLTPAFLVEIGGSSVDVVVSIPSLAALACTMYWLRQRSREDSWSDWRWLWLAALLSGFACGLKPTAVVFALALGLATLIVLRRMALSGLWRMLVGGSLGLILGGGGHALMLWRAFGNPVFPLFNSVFKSPWFPPVSQVSDRFRPASLWDAMRYPLDLADAYTRPGLEILAVDYRSISLLILLGIVGLQQFFFRFRKTSFASRINTVVEYKHLVCITLVLFVPAWLYTSANTRYAIQAFLLIGPIFVWVALHLKGKTEFWVLLTVALAFAVQSAATFLGNDVRLDSISWGEAWFPWRIPDDVQKHPANYLSLQVQAYAVIAIKLPQQSRLTNLLGQVPLDPSGMTWLRVKKMKDMNALPWRSLFEVQTSETGGVPLKNLENQDAVLSEYGLKAERSSCVFVEWNREDIPATHWVKEEFTTISKYKSILSCLLVDAAPLPVEEVLQRQVLDARFARWEMRCPNVFAPSSPTSVQSTWSVRIRFYQNTEVILQSFKGKLLALFPSGRLIILEDERGKQISGGCPVPERFGKLISLTR